MNKKVIYLAGPWFTDRQDEILQETKLTLDSVPVKYYSPKDEMLFTPGGPTDPIAVLNSNTTAIKDADILVCVTDGKDTGTMFEAGYACALDKPIFYLWVDHERGQKFNLMLGASGIICMSFDELASQITEYFISGTHLIPTLVREGIIYE